MRKARTDAKTYDLSLLYTNVLVGTRNFGKQVRCDKVCTSETSAKFVIRRDLALGETLLAKTAHFGDSSRGRQERGTPACGPSHHENRGPGQSVRQLVSGQAVRDLRASLCVVPSLSLASGFRLGISLRWTFESLA